MKLSPIVSSLIAVSLLIASTHPVDAQKKRPAGVASLLEMSCQPVSGGQYVARNQDISVGFEIFRAVGVVGGITENSISQSVCRLAQAKEKPKYKTLTLAFGMSDGEAKNDSKIRLSLYKDGKAYDYKDVTKGEKLLWQIDVTGTRSLAVEIECIRGGSCPYLYFFEDTLK